MTRKDCVSAVGAAALAMAIDITVLACAILIHALAADPGHGVTYYLDIASGLGGWSTRIVGPYAMGLLVWQFSRRAPERNACVFGLWVWVAHFAMYAVALRLGFFTPDVMMTMALKLIGALIGASLAMTSLTASEEDRP